MPTNNSWNNANLMTVSQGGTSSTSFSTSTGVVKYDGASLVTSATDVLSAGNISTNTSQPGCVAYLATNATNATGNGAVFTIGTGTAFTITTNQGSNFNSNGTFTAPVTGLYMFRVGSSLSNLGGATGMVLNLVAGGITYLLLSANPTAIRNPGASACVNRACLVIPMTANNTAILTIEATGVGADTVTVLGSGTRITFFSAALVC